MWFEEGPELSPSYVRTLAIILGSVIKYSTIAGYCPPLKNPILKPQLPKNEIQILSEDSHKKLISYMIEKFDETSMGISITLNTGMRIGEICALQWSDIDFENETIKVCKTVSRVLDSNGSTKRIIDLPKTKSSIRKIPIPSSLMVQLRNFLPMRKSEFIVSTNLLPVDTRTFDYRYKRVLQSAGIPQYNFHALRHTFATNCINYGVDVKVLSEILGHSNVSTTLNTYVHLSLKMKKQQIEKIVQMT